MREIILYGAGKRCERICRLYFTQSSVKIAAIFDKEPDKVNKELFGFKIMNLEKIREYQNFSLCITVGDKKVYMDILTELRDLYGYTPVELIAYSEIVDILSRDYVLSALKKRKKNFEKVQEHKIVFDCSNGLSLGGIEEWTKGLCWDLVDSNEKDIHILTDDGSYDVSCLIEKMIDQVIMKQQSASDNLINIINYLIQNLPLTLISSHPNTVLEISSIIKRCVPDQIKIIAVVHGGEERIYRAYERFIPIVDYFVGVSKDIREALISMGASKERAAAITCPVQCEQNLCRNYTVDELQPIRIGYAGRLEIEQKRMDLMLNMLEILEERNVNYLMEFAGDGEYRTEMENVTKNRRWKRVRFIGILDRKQIPDFWTRQDVCVNISDYEGRSITQLEAMANGAVPVVTRTSGTREDIKNGVNGYLVDIGGYKEMVDRIVDLEGHRDKLKEMGMLSHDIVFPKCDRSKHTEFWKKLIKTY